MAVKGVMICVPVDVMVSNIVLMPMGLYRRFRTRTYVRIFVQLVMYATTGMSHMIDRSDESPRIPAIVSGIVKKNTAMMRARTVAKDVAAAIKAIPVLSSDGKGIAVSKRPLITVAINAAIEATRM